MMRQFLTTVFATMLGVVAGVILLVILAIMAISAQLASLVEDSAPPADQTQGSIVLELDLRTARLDQPSRSLLPAAGPASLLDVVRALKAAENDERVAGVFVRAGDGVTPADAEEIHRALEGVSESGKFVIAHIQSLSGGSTSPYLAISSADDIWMHPSGWLAATGLRSEQIFLGEALAQLGAESQFLQLYEYKGAAELFTRSGFSAATREATEAWLTSVFETSIGEIATGRALNPDAAAMLVQNGPYLADEAVELNLVDRLGQVETARAAALSLAPSARLMAIDDYARILNPPARGPVVAIVSGQGPVVDGTAPMGLTAPAALASDTMAAAIDAAAADESVRAIVVRIDTGGGSATASDQIAEAIDRARRGGTPVVVSFGSVAASGGYYIASAADHIVSNAGTLTGSIGVVSGKVAFGPALERAGVTFDSVTVGGPFTGANSPASGYSAEQQAAIEAWAEAIYADFTMRVAEGRDLPLARVEQLARGRIWSGAQALELGLVDEIGGFNEAVEAARRLARISPDETVRLQAYPQPLEGLDRLRAILGQGMAIGESLETLSSVLARPDVQALMREVEASDSPVALEDRRAEPN